MPITFYGICVTGNYTLKVQSTPMLKHVLYEATKMLQPAVLMSEADKHKTLYDLWAERSPDDDKNDMPK